MCLEICPTLYSNSKVKIGRLKELFSLVFCTNEPKGQYCAGNIPLCMRRVLLKVTKLAVKLIILYTSFVSLEQSI